MPRKHDCHKYDVAFSVLTSNEFEIILQIMEVPILVEEGTPQEKKNIQLNVGGGGGGGGGSDGGGGGSGNGGGGDCC
jgi:uncharacterized membrane protein YgcG